MKTQCLTPITLVVLICFALTTFGPPAAFAGPFAKAGPGPGLSHPVLATAYMGKTLIVSGTAPGWYYVHLPDITYGWEMQQFVIIPGGGTQG